MEKDFIKYIKQERRNFVRKVNEQNWNTELRTAAENLLLAYDQMFLELSVGKPDSDTEANDNKHAVIKSVCQITPICKIKIDDDSCNPTDCPYFVRQTVF